MSDIVEVIEQHARGVLDITDVTLLRLFFDTPRVKIHHMRLFVSLIFNVFCNIGVYERAGFGYSLLAGVHRRVSRRHECGLRVSVRVSSRYTDTPGTSVDDWRTRWREPGRSHFGQLAGVSSVRAARVASASAPAHLAAQCSH